MKIIQDIIDQLYRVKFLKSVTPVMKAMDNFLHGPNTISKSAPFIRDGIEMKRFMAMVVIALLPTTAFSVYLYGIRVIWMILVSYIFGGLVEVLFAVFRKTEIEEGFLVTGLIFPLILPPSLPLWMVAVGVVEGVFFGKEVFGGTGKNIFNPALVGRLFLTLSFPQAMSIGWIIPFTGAVTTATPLALFKISHQLTGYSQLFGGVISGSIAETFKIGILAGGLFLICLKIIDWRIPVYYILSVAVFALLGNMFIPARIAPPIFQILTGGLLFGAFFMATDPVTSPFSRSGKIIYGILLGFLTLVIRSFSLYPEGVMFSIITMNAFAPLFDLAAIKSKFRRGYIKR